MSKIYVFGKLVAGVELFHLGPNPAALFSCFVWLLLSSSFFFIICVDILIKDQVVD